jgi:hypothetical protein
MARLLLQCPGFPLDETIADAWSEARFESSGRHSQLAVLAARLGDKEALREALVQCVSHEKAEDLRLLEEALDRPIGEPLLTWAHRNFDALAFDPASKRFGLR